MSEDPTPYTTSPAMPAEGLLRRLLTGGTEKFTFGFSCLIAAFSIFNWRLGLSVAETSRAGMFAADIAVSVVLYVGFLVFWTPLIHLFAERDSAGARALIRESNIATAALALALPMGLLFRALSMRAPMAASDLLLRLFFIWRFSTAVMKIYSMGRLKSLLIITSPGSLFVFWTLTTSLACVVKLWQFLR
ncbi:MAG: hypothetical protein QME32_08240 [Endomicrobiia bacterium]|nr:hypothetical protein [Endomicrobiia bacterium]